MLSIKAILGRYKQLPTIIFDEIDTGVSGEIAHKMATIMEGMRTHPIDLHHTPSANCSEGNHHKKVLR